MNPVIHFELPSDDAARMQKFYQSAFGWQTQQMGPEMGNYVLATTTETDANRMVKTPGTINGGFYKRTTERDKNARIAIQVEDIYDAMKKIKEAGGTVLGGMQSPDKADEIPGVGLYATFLDTEGNYLSLLQPVRR